MKKSDLRGYFDKKFKSLKEAVQEEVREIFLEAFANAYDYPHCPNAEVISQLGEVADNLERVYEAHDLMGYWDYKNLVTSLRGAKGEKFFENRLRDYVNEAYNAYLYQNTPHLPNKSLEVTYGVLVRDNQELKNLSKKLEDLKKLETEIDAIISANTAHKAFKLLKELGVDMNDLEASTAPMPVPVKLSVDVCVLNGGCD